MWRTLACGLIWIAGLQGADERDGPERTETPRAARIQWFGTLEQGLREAARTGRPILLSSASPSCDGVPGKW